MNLRVLSIAGFNCPGHVAQGHYKCEVCAPWVRRDSFLYHRQVWEWSDPVRSVYVYETSWMQMTYTPQHLPWTEPQPIYANTISGLSKNVFDERWLDDLTVARNGKIMSYAQLRKLEAK